jgi:hypothetical protein
VTLLPLLAVLLLAGASLEVRAAAAIERLCPCPAGDVACAAQHLRAARAIGAVAADEDTAIRLVGLGELLAVSRRPRKGPSAFLGEP